MTKFTPEEISLCKQVAERHKRDIEYGDWYWDKGLKKAVVLCVKLSHIQNDPYFIKNCIPLWTISDCLEFLKEKGWNDIAIEMRPYLGDIKCFAERGEVDKGCEREVDGEGKTPLEACLKAVLAVLEEKK